MGASGTRNEKINASIIIHAIGIRIIYYITRDTIQRNIIIYFRVILILMNIYIILVYRVIREKKRVFRFICFSL